MARIFVYFEASTAVIWAGHMSRASPANRAASILSPLNYGVSNTQLGELKLKGIAALSNMKACHQAK